VQQFRHSQQVVRGSNEVRGALQSVEARETRAPESADDSGPFEISSTRSRTR
jgi:hypothetical protein